MTTSAEVLQFRRKLPPMSGSASAEHYNAQLQRYVIDRQHLAEWLREMADLIEADQVFVEPRAALVVLSGSTTSEALHMGFGRAGGPTMTDAYQAARQLFNQQKGQTP